MPPGRPSKRTGESADGNSSDEPSSGKLKSQRTQRASTQHDFSSVVKSKLQSYTRTGQACDRCKVRKIRCDALPEGCSHCISQNLECYVTDRVTGRTERRGYTQELEREKAAMMAQIRTLERMLESNGIQTTRFQWPPQSFDSPRRSSSRSNFEAAGQDNPHQPSHLSTPIPPSSPFSTSESVSINAPQARYGGRPPLVSYSGLRLTILGSNIDLGASNDVDPRDVALRPIHAPSDYSPAEKSMLHMLRNLQQPEPVELPPWSEALHYTEWYFANIYQFFPILHKPTFFASLRNLYDHPDSLSIEPADLVTIHVVFAITLRQIGSTSVDHAKRSQLHTWSDKHYLLALGKFSELSALRNLKDCQAMAHVLFHSMRYSKPRFSVLISNEALALAIELNLHRAGPSSTNAPRLENEMRKRLWWSILWLSIIVLGRIGRPMPLGLHEMDVDYPEALSDEMLESSGAEVSSTGDCPFLVALWTMRATKMYLYMFSTIHGVSSKPSSYLTSLKQIEQQFKRWQDSLPESLRVSESDFTDPKGNAHDALYIHYIGLNFQLYLHHPMVVPGDDPGLLEGALHASEDNVKALLRCRLALRKLRSNEGTWLALGTYTTAAFLHLASCWQRRRDLNSTDHAELHRDMVSWLTIINDTCQLLENGQRLPNAINNIINRTLVWIEQDHRGSGSESSASHSTQDMLNDAPHNPGYMSSISSMMPSQTMVDSRGRSTAPYALPSRPGFYPDPSVYGQSMGYSSAHMHAQSTSDYSSPSHYMYEGQMRLDQPIDHAHSGPIQRSGSTIDPYASSSSTMQQQSTQHRMWRSHSSAAPDEPELSTGIGSSGSGPATGDPTWHEWNTAMAGSQDSRYGSNALIGMGQQPGPQQSEGNISAPSDMNMGIVPDVPVQSENLAWPNMLYPGSSGRNHGT